MSVEGKLLDAGTPSEDPGQRQVLLPIIRIVLTQAARFRRRGAITEERFEAQLHRLALEELEPRGLELLVRDLPCGTTRFMIKAKSTGIVCEMIDCPGD